MIFSPTLAGQVAVRSRPEAFLDALRHRVEQGLLTGHRHPRSHYAVTGSGSDRLIVSAADFKTAFNVGLNHVEVVLDGSGRVRYRIEYWKWAKYAVILSAIVGAVLLLVLLSIDLPRYIETHPGSSLPGLSVEGNVAVAWGMAIFWGLVWPWVLIAFHKRPLRRLFERILAEVDATASAGGPGAGAAGG